MHFSSLVLAVALVPAVFVSAQSGTETSPAPTSTAGITPCILTCVTDASSSAGCAGITDVQCLCTSSSFQTAAATCLQANCTADDLAAGLALQQQQCAAVSGASSLTSAISSDVSSAASEATSLTSVASSAVSGASSVASSVAGSLTSRVSSASSAATSSGASAAASESASDSKASLDSGGVFLSGVFGLLGLAAGSLLV